MTTAKEDTTEQDPTKDSKQAATPPPADGAVHVDASSRKIQKASENIERLQLTPAVEPSMNTSRSYARKYTTKQAATSPPAGENTKRLQLAPAVYLPPTSGNEKANEELEEVGNYKETAIPNKMVKKIGTSTQTRQEKRRIRIAEHRSREDTNLAPSPPTIEGEEDDLRQQILAEQMGQVARAEIVEDDGSNTRRSALLGAGIVVILLAIILGTVFGTGDNSPGTISSVPTEIPISSVPTETPSETPTLRPSPSPSMKPSQAPTVAPLNNSICAEAHTIALGNAAIIEASLQNAMEQVVVFCEFPDQPSYSQRGLWYKYTGQDKAVVAKANGGVALHVYPACGQTAPPSCDITDTFYGGSSASSSNTVAWTAASGVEYLLLVTSTELSSSSTTRESFELQIVDNEFCEGAFGPITPGAGIVLSGSTSDGATIDAQAPRCGSASSPSAPGVWHTIIGDGRAITASTCIGTSTDFDTQISIFTGSSCDELTCVDGSNDACGSQSRVDFPSIQDQTYHVLVHGFGDALGTFTLSIARSLVTLTSLFVVSNISIQALQDVSTPQYAALDWMANIDSTDLQNTLSNDALVERFVLLLLYFATDGANWSDQYLFLSPSLDICSWNTGSPFEGVRGCNDEGSVTSLYLFDIGLIGSLPTEIGLLSRLEILVLSSNALTGTLPTQLGSLSSLLFLFLDDNKLSGAVPSELGQIVTLETLFLKSSGLTGTLPPQIDQNQVFVIFP